MMTYMRWKVILLLILGISANFGLPIPPTRVEKSIMLVRHAKGMPPNVLKSVKGTDPNASRSESSTQSDITWREQIEHGHEYNVKRNIFALKRPIKRALRMPRHKMMNSYHEYLKNTVSSWMFPVGITQENVRHTKEMPQNGMTTGQVPSSKDNYLHTSTKRGKIIDALPTVRFYTARQLQRRPLAPYPLLKASKKLMAWNISEDKHESSTKSPEKVYDELWISYRNPYHDYTTQSLRDSSSSASTAAAETTTTTSTLSQPPTTRISTPTGTVTLMTTISTITPAQVTTDVKYMNEQQESVGEYSAVEYEDNNDILNIISSQNYPTTATRQGNLPSLLTDKDQNDFILNYDELYQTIKELNGPGGSTEDKWKIPLRDMIIALINTGPLKQQETSSKFLTITGHTAATKFLMRNGFHQFPRRGTEPETSISSPATHPKFSNISSRSPWPWTFEIKSTTGELHLNSRSTVRMTNSVPTVRSKFSASLENWTTKLNFGLTKQNTSSFPTEQATTLIRPAAPYIPPHVLLRPR